MFADSDPSFKARLQSQLSVLLNDWQQSWLFPVVKVVSTLGEVTPASSYTTPGDVVNIAGLTLAESRMGAVDTEPVLVSVDGAVDRSDSPLSSALDKYKLALFIIVGLAALAIIVVLLLCWCGCLRMMRRPRRPAVRMTAPLALLAGLMQDGNSNHSSKDMVESETGQTFSTSDTSEIRVGKQFCIHGDELVQLDSSIPYTPSLHSLHNSMKSPMPHSLPFGFDGGAVGNMLHTVGEDTSLDEFTQTSHRYKDEEAGNVMEAHQLAHGFIPGSFGHGVMSSRPGLLSSARVQHKHGELLDYKRSSSAPEQGQSIEQEITEMADFNSTSTSIVPVGDPALAANQKGVTSSIMKLISRLKVEFDTLKFNKEIGRGSSKTVFLGRWGSTNVAIVRMKKGGMVTEARIMQKLGTHPNLVQFYRWARDHQGNEYMIIELVRKGSLDKLLTDPSLRLKDGDKLKICEQICDAMCELAKEGLLHCDLAARNVLVASIDPIHVKVGDFGLSREWQNLDGGSVSRQMIDCIPLRWAPPEVFREGRWSEKSDVWAFGVTMWEVFSGGEEPFVRDLGDVNNPEIIEYVTSGNTLSQPEGCPDEVFLLMKDCWRFEPEIRPTFDHLQARFRSLRDTARRRSDHMKKQGSAPWSNSPSPWNLMGPSTGPPGSHLDCDADSVDTTISFTHSSAYGDVTTDVAVAHGYQWSSHPHGVTPHRSMPHRAGGIWRSPEHHGKSLNTRGAWTGKAPVRPSNLSRHGSITGNGASSSDSSPMMHGSSHLYAPITKVMASCSVTTSTSPAPTAEQGQSASSPHSTVEMRNLQQSMQVEVRSGVSPYADIRALMAQSSPSPKHGPPHDSQPASPMSPDMPLPSQVPQQTNESSGAKNYLDSVE